MSLFLKLAFLFFIGSVLGWVLELFYRRFFSKNNPERKWINPGFCTGPYLPLYGSGLCLLYLIASLEKRQWAADPVWNKVILFAMMAVCMTVIEYIAGYVSLHVFGVRLWDYSKEWGNIDGIICPKFSAAWAVLGAVYYFAVHPHILDALNWLGRNLAFSFVIGLFFGVFILDAAHSVKMLLRMRQFSRENQVVVRCEALKSHIRKRHEEMRSRYNFFRPLHGPDSLSEHMKQAKDTFEARMPKLRRKKNV